MKKKGFTLVEIMIVVAIIGLLAAIAIPSFMKSRTVSQANTCINNLRQCESAKEQWAMNEGLADGYEVLDTDRADIFVYLRGEPFCPLDRADPQAGYDLGEIGSAVTTCPVDDAAEAAVDVDSLDPRHILPAG